MEGWVDLGGWLHTEIPQSARRQSPIQVLTRPSVKQQLCWSDKQRVIATPRHQPCVIRYGRWRSVALPGGSNYGMHHCEQEERVSRWQSDSHWTNMLTNRSLAAATAYRVTFKCRGDELSYCVPTTRYCTSVHTVYNSRHGYQMH